MKLASVLSINQERLLECGCRVIGKLGRRKVYSLSSGERGKTHTILSCVSASGYSLPPMMVYPRKRAVHDNCKEGCISNTLFKSSSNGWINTDLFLDWYKFFKDNIPPIRPVLLIMDGHGSHISIELIELARLDGIYLLCLPAHTTHILQPLDIGVFKSFKANFSKTCSKYMSTNRGRVITTDKLAMLVAEAWPLSFTPVNIMSGFKKCGIFPLNPSAVSDRQTAPSKTFRQQTSKMSPESESCTPSQQLFSPEKEALFKKQYGEGYDIFDPEYVAWIKINHPEVSSSTFNSSATSSPTCSSIEHKLQETKSDDPLSDILVLPSLPDDRTEKSHSTTSVNSKAVCITNDEFLEQLKDKSAKKAEAEREKVQKKQLRIQKQEEKRLLVEQKKKEKERKKKEREVLAEKKQLAEQKRKEKEQLAQQKRKEKEMSAEQKRKESEALAKKRREVLAGKKSKAREAAKKTKEKEVLADERTAKRKEKEALAEKDLVEEEDTCCPNCGILLAESDDMWVGCDGCDLWYDFPCTGLRKENIPDSFYCDKCTDS